MRTITVPGLPQTVAGGASPYTVSVSIPAGTYVSMSTYVEWTESGVNAVETMDVAVGGQLAWTITGGSGNSSYSETSSTAALNAINAAAGSAILVSVSLAGRSTVNWTPSLIEFFLGDAQPIAGGIGSTLALGSPALTQAQTIAGGIASTLLVGTPALAQAQRLEGGIASTLAIGAPVVTQAQHLAGGIASTLVFGSGRLAQAQPVGGTGAGIASTLTMGASGTLANILSTGQPLPYPALGTQGWPFGSYSDVVSDGWQLHTGWAVVEVPIVSGIIDLATLKTLVPGATSGWFFCLGQPTFANQGVTVTSDVCGHGSCYRKLDTLNPPAVIYGYEFGTSSSPCLHDSGANDYVAHNHRYTYGAGYSLLPPGNPTRASDLILTGIDNQSFPITAYTGYTIPPQPSYPRKFDAPLPPFDAGLEYFAGSQGNPAQPYPTVESDGGRCYQTKDGDYGMRVPNDPCYAGGAMAPPAATPAPDKLIKQHTGAVAATMHSGDTLLWPQRNNFALTPELNWIPSHASRLTPFDVNLDTIVYFVMGQRHTYYDDNSRDGSTLVIQREYQHPDRAYFFYRGAPPGGGPPGGGPKKKGTGSIGSWVHCHRMGATVLFRTTNADPTAPSGDITLNIQDKYGGAWGDDLLVKPGGVQATGANPRGLVHSDGTIYCLYGGSLTASTDWGQSWEESVALLDGASPITLDEVRDGTLLAAGFVQDDTLTDPTSPPMPCPAPPAGVTPVPIKYGYIYVRRKPKGATAWETAVRMKDETGADIVFQKNSFHFDQGHEGVREYRLFASVRGYCAPQVLYSSDHGLTWTIDQKAFGTDSGVSTGP